MNSSGRCTSIAISCIGIFVSLIIGVIIGVLFAFQIFVPTLNTLWITVALALLLLFLALLALFLATLSMNSPLTDCLRRDVPLLLTAVLGTLILALILSSVSLASVIAASILIGIEAFFVALSIIATISLAGCILGELR